MLVNSVEGSKRTAKLSNKEVESRQKSKEESTRFLLCLGSEAVVVSSPLRKEGIIRSFEIIFSSSIQPEQTLPISITDPGRLSTKASKRSSKTSNFLYLDERFIIEAKFLKV